MLRGKTIEEIVNKWSADLEVHVKEFNTFASEVAAWDRALMENSSSVSISLAIPHLSRPPLTSPKDLSYLLRAGQIRARTDRN